MPITNTSTTKPKRLASDLAPEDWIKAGFNALTESGPAGIKVDRLAKALNISRGSFYWHFKSAKALKQAMLAYWVQVGTEDVILLAEGEGQSALEKLTVLGQRISGPRDSDYGGVLAESAIRDWGRYDADVGQAVESVTRKRLDYLRALFEELGLPNADAKTRANLLYGAMIGLEFLTAMEVADMETELSALMQMFVQLPTSSTERGHDNE